MTDRIPCAVPFCRRTKGRAAMKAGDNSFLRPNHWQLIPRPQKRLYAKARRQGRERLSHWMWDRLIKSAIQRAGAC